MEIQTLKDFVTFKKVKIEEVHLVHPNGIVYGYYLIRIRRKHNGKQYNISSIRIDDLNSTDSWQIPKKEYSNLLDISKTWIKKVKNLKV